MFYRGVLSIGILLFLVASVILKQSLIFVARCERLTGTVVKLEASSGDGDDSYVPVFKVKTPGHQEIMYRHNISTSPPSWDIGEQATFLYDPDHPSKIRLLSYFGVFSWSIVLMGAAVFLIVIGGSYFFLQRYLQVSGPDEKGNYVAI